MSDTALSTWCNMDHAYLTRNSLAITNHCFEPIRPADTNLEDGLNLNPPYPIKVTLLTLRIFLR